MFILEYILSNPEEFSIIVLNVLNLLYTFLSSRSKRLSKIIHKEVNHNETFKDSIETSLFPAVPQDSEKDA